jgi:hypothetical protein
MSTGGSHLTGFAPFAFDHDRILWEIACAQGQGSSLLSGVRRAAAERFATSPDRPFQARQLNTGVKGDIKTKGKRLKPSSLCYFQVS